MAAHRGKYKGCLACMILCMALVALFLAEVMKPGTWLPLALDDDAVPATLCKCPDCSRDSRDISQKLLNIHLALQSSITHQSAPLPGILLDLEGVIEKLNPAYMLSKTREEAKANGSSSAVVDVCPEEYLGELHDYPYYKTGWVLTNCSNTRPLSKVVTILLNTVDYPERDEKQVDVVLDGINKTYPGVHTFLAPKNDRIKEWAGKYQHVTVVETAREASSLAIVWNKLASMVTTPYTLVARDIVHFDFNARLERQIRMISETDHVGIVGGSFRNLTGHWRVGCRQTRMMNYVLKLQEGYHHSRKSCMFCDDLEGPFISKTELLKSTRFHETFPNEVIFEDFFIRVMNSSHLVMNCPDVMYYTNEILSEVKRTSKQVWQSFAREWVLVRILLPGKKHVFSCKEISYKCNIRDSTKYAAVPKCCLEEWGQAMHLMQDICTKNNIPMELDSGSVLAALKFNNYSPFDIDGDMNLSSLNISFFRSYESFFKTNGYSLRGYKDATYDSKAKMMKGGFFEYYTPDIITEVWGWTKMSGDIYLPPELRNIKYFTKVLMDGQWINAAFNPGLYSRNRYGPDVLKHAQSWRHVGGKSSWIRYKSGQFVPCNKPNFHSCLDKFPGDGNIAFKVDDFP